MLTFIYVTKTIVYLFTMQKAGTLYVLINNTHSYSTLGILKSNFLRKENIALETEIAKKHSTFTGPKNIVFFAYC